MKVLLLNGSANKKGNTFTALSEIANRLEKNGVEAEIMQLADNMAWLLKKIHADGNPDYPEREDWQCMNFIR